MEKLMRMLMISCQKAGELIEKKIDKQISLVERFELFFHTSVCNACRTYEKQSKLIQKAIDHRHKPPQKPAPDHLKEKLKEQLK